MGLARGCCAPLLNPGLSRRCGHPRSNGRHGRRRPGGGPWLPKRRGSGPARSSAASASVGSMPSSASKGPRGDWRCRRPPAPPARGRLRSRPAGIRRAARRGRFGRKPTGFPPSRALSAGCLAAPGAHVTFFTGYPGLVSPGWQMLGLRESRRRWLSTHFRIGTPPSGHSSNR